MNGGALLEPQQAAGDAQAAEVDTGEGPPAAPTPPADPATTACGYRDRADLPDMPGYALRRSIDAAHGGEAVTAVRFDREGRRLASAGGDATAAIWDAETGELLHRLKGHAAGISGERRKGGRGAVPRRVACCIARPSSTRAISAALQTWPGRPTAASWPPHPTTTRCACGTPPAASACAT